MGEMPELDITLGRILISPSPEDLWQLQTALLATGGETALHAREVAGEFYSFLRDLESKIASRSASRWGAVLETASVTSVGLQEMLAEQADPLKRLFASSVTAMLEIGAAVKNVQAWEVESSLVYYDVAWHLYGELWDVSLAARPDLPTDERVAMLDRLLRPIADTEVDDASKSALLVRLFQVALTARVMPLLTATD